MTPLRRALVLSGGLLALAVPLAWWLGPPPAGSGAAPAEGLPWQVQAGGDGRSRVMGLHLGHDTLRQVRARVGDSLQVALVARLDEVGALEAFADPFQAGFVAGRMVLAFDVDAETLRRWRQAARGSTPMEGGVRRFTLAPADLEAAAQAPLASLSFVPQLRLGEADIRQRFGEPAARRVLDDGAVWLLYPALGVAATVAEGRRGVIQYVAPRDAARLGAVVAAAATAAQRTP